MDIQVHEKEYCKLDVSYEADADQIDNKKVEVLSLFKKAPVPGFRKGKANLEVIKIHYKKQIEESLKRALAEEAFHNTMFEKNIKPLGQPDFTSILLQGTKFNCNFSINVKPSFELTQYKGFEIPKPHNTVSANDLAEQMVEELRTQYGEMNPFDENDFVEMGDKIIISYDGFMDGEKLDNISSAGELVTVGTNPLKAFDENLLGMKIGEVREFDVVVPDSGLASFKNKTIHFSATMSIGSKITKCALDDSLAQKVGRASLQELREFALSLASSKLDESNRSALSKQITSRLLSLHDFEVPSWLSLSEAQYLAANSQKVWDTLPDSDKESFLSLASENVKLALILDKIREVEPEAQLSDQEVIELIKNNIARSQQNVDETLIEMNKTGYLSVLVVRLRDENTLDFVLKNSTVIE